MKSNKQKNRRLTLWLSEISAADIASVGGKNSSLGEMYCRLTKKGIRVPDAFVVTTAAFRKFLKENELEELIFGSLRALNKNKISDLRRVGAQIRTRILKAKFSQGFRDEVLRDYDKLSSQYKEKNCSVAVRSSATAEDMPKTSFAGQQESYLNVHGGEELLTAIKACMSSLYTDRSISYRVDQGIAHEKVSISVAVQKMVRSDKGSAGIIFTLDTESGFDKVVLINSVFGLGENIVKGRISPDEFLVFKPFLGKVKQSIISKRLGSKKLKMIYASGSIPTKNINTSIKERQSYSINDSQVKVLAKAAVLIEKHYKRPMDIEWALDGVDGRLYIVQARPETVYRQQKNPMDVQYRLQKKGIVIATGDSIGSKIGAGSASVIANVNQIATFRAGSVLVARMTDPDWEPIMKKASAIITESGGRTCHAAIVSRELGIPCIVGAKGVMKKIKTGKKVTVDCSQGEVGNIHEGILPFKIISLNLKTSRRKHRPAVMLNLGDPDSAFKYANWPHQGVGLARLEFIITNFIKIHPLALINYKKLTDKKVTRKIDELTVGYADKKQYYVEKLAFGIAKIAAAFHPFDVIVRFSDFKSNEYANLIGGSDYEPKEENPMIGWRGAVRYYDPIFRPAFDLECQAIKMVREAMGFTNVKVMVPFCRTIEEGKKVLAILKKNKLVRGENNLEVYMMVEIPSNVILAEKFAKLFDGFSIGSNDLTQLTLGLDRDSGIIKHVGDERNEAVQRLISQVIKISNKSKTKIGFCGQAPSDLPGYALFLAKAGIDSVSVTPDSLIKTIKSLSGYSR